MELGGLVFPCLKTSSSRRLGRILGVLALDADLDLARARICRRAASHMPKNLAGMIQKSLDAYSPSAGTRIRRLAAGKRQSGWVFDVASPFQLRPSGLP